VWRVLSEAVEMIVGPVRITTSWIPYTLKKYTSALIQPL